MIYYENVTTIPFPANGSSMSDLEEKLSSCSHVMAVLAAIAMITIIGFSVTTVGWIHSCTKLRKLTNKEEKQCVDLKQDILQEIDRFEGQMLNKHRPAWCVCRNNLSDKLIKVDKQYFVSALHVLGYLCRGSGVLTDTSPVLFYLGDMDVRRQDVQNLLKDMRDTYIKLKHLISKYTLEMKSAKSAMPKTPKNNANSHINIVRKETYKREFIRDAVRIFVSLDFDGNTVIVEEMCSFFDIKIEDFVSIGEHEINKYLPYAYMMSLENEILDIIYPMENRLQMDVGDCEIVGFLEEIEFSCSRSKRYLECAELDDLYSTIVQLCDTHGFIDSSQYDTILQDTMKVMNIRHMVRLLLHNIFEIKMKNASRKIVYADDVRKMYNVFNNTECDSKETTGAKCERVCAEIRQGLYFICTNSNPELTSEDMLATLKSNEKAMSEVIRKVVRKQ